MAQREVLQGERPVRLRGAVEGPEETPNDVEHAGDRSPESAPCSTIPERTTFW
jgi:hypothetical protein